MAQPFKLRSQASTFKMMGSSPILACGPGGKSNTGAKCGNFKVNKKGTVVSRAANKVANFFKNNEKNRQSNKNTKKKTNFHNSDGGSHKTVRYL